MALHGGCRYVRFQATQTSQLYVGLCPIPLKNSVNCQFASMS
jgi:hypothetical protein